MRRNSIVRLYTPEQADAFIKSLWQTDDFRTSHEEGGYIADIVSAFTRLPSFFYEPSDDEKEKPHFSVWWRGIQFREYDNSVVHDLYLLHELFHGGDMVYGDKLSFDAWKRKMTDNELGASVCSELEVYFKLKDLRQRSFPHEILADRFLNNPDIQLLWQDDENYVLRELRMHRQNIMMSEFTKDHADRVEFWIKQFMYQNDCWAGIWVHRFPEVEQAGRRLLLRAMTGDRQGALDSHIDDWLLSAAVSFGGDIPFPHEATAFSGVYWANKAAYAREFSPAPTQPVAPNLQDTFRP